MSSLELMLLIYTAGAVIFFVAVARHWRQWSR